jgi:glutamine synthetase
MCDCYTPQGEPIPTNKRHNAAKIFSNPDVAVEEPWYNIYLFFLSLNNSENRKVFVTIIPFKFNFEIFEISY